MRETVLRYCGIQEPQRGSNLEAKGCPVIVGATLDNVPTTGPTLKGLRFRAQPRATIRIAPHT